MKRSQVLHSWRRVSEQWDGRSTIGGLRISAANSGFAEGVVDLTGGVMLLVGVNSSGKSRLLKNLHKSLSGTGSAFVSIAWNGVIPKQGSYVDIFSLVERQVSFFRDNGSVDDLVEQAGLTAFRAQEQKEASSLIGRSYDSIDLAELDNVDQGVPQVDAQTYDYRSDVVPYFRVRTHGQQFDSRDLSRGELSVLTTLWVLKQLIKGEVLIWDEPDAFLSPASAGRLLSTIANSANSSKTPMVISSHSYLGVSTVPVGIQVMLRLGSDGVSTIEGPTRYSLWQTLRITPPKDIAFVVEDVMAKKLLDRLLIEIDYPYYDFAEIWTAGDVSKVLDAGKFPDCFDGTLRLVGVVDGDSRGSVPSKGNVISLPGADSPETIAIAIMDKDPDCVGASGADRVRDLLDSTVGQDPHDRLQAVAEGLGRDASGLLLECWIYWVRSKGEGASALNEFKLACEGVTPPKPVT